MSKNDTYNDIIFIPAVMTYLERPDMPSLTGGPLKTSFIFAQMHFHWNQDNHTGSEHAIDGKK